ncbi:MAG: hypothetical protein LC772_12555, partial [Chloroflexi bacterium]|nr:hypothetical protein [Chloroflexota bacterium]
MSNLYTLDLKTRQVSRLTDTTAAETDPCFSRDGRSLAYSSRLPDQHTDHIFIMDLSKKQIRQITWGNFSDRYPSFSPDGQQLQFARGDKYIQGMLTNGWRDWDVYRLA